MYLVVFRSRKRADIDCAAYDAQAQAMERLARNQPGFLSFKSYVADDGEVIALSEWASEAAACGWRAHRGHAKAQAHGRSEYYESYTLFTCASPRVTQFDRSEN